MAKLYQEATARTTKQRYGTDIKVVDARTGNAVEIWHWTSGGFISSSASDFGGSAR
jgi:hypothetical protein